MSTILLQLESALADARAAQERAAERLHDTGVQHALAKSQYDAASEAVKRVEGALNSMHGVATAAPSAPVTSESRPTGSGLASDTPAPKKRREELSGPMCNGCGEAGKIVRVSAQLARCMGCSAEYPQ